MIEPDNKNISVSLQCPLLNISRSGYYYVPNGLNEIDLLLLNETDEIYTRLPYYGSRKISAELCRRGYNAGRQKVRSLMKRLGISAIYPKKSLSIPDKDHKIYPYLLRNLSIDCSDKVWCTDITYIRLHGGFVYLVAVMDWYSRYVLSWRLSNTLDTGFCVDALKEALKRYGSPEYFNTDQGSQFTSIAFTDVLKERDVKISMDGRGRVFDNIFIERLWRSLKYEEVYIKSYESVLDCRRNIQSYFEIYNSERLHEALDYNLPSEIYFQNKGKEAA